MSMNEISFYKKKKKLMWLVSLQQDNKWVFVLLFIIYDTLTYKAYIIKFIIFQTSLIFVYNNILDSIIN